MWSIILVSALFWLLVVVFLPVEIRWTKWLYRNIFLIWLSEVKKELAA